MDSKETQAAKSADATAPQSVPRGISVFAILKTFLTLDEFMTADTVIAAYCYPYTKRMPKIQLTSS